MLIFLLIKSLEIKSKKAFPFSNFCSVYSVQLFIAILIILITFRTATNTSTGFLRSLPYKTFFTHDVEKRNFQRLSLLKTFASGCTNDRESCNTADFNLRLEQCWWHFQMLLKFIASFLIITYNAISTANGLFNVFSQSYVEEQVILCRKRFEGLPMKIRSYYLIFHENGSLCVVHQNQF